MKLAIVVGGWHWPAEFFRKMAEQAAGAELFVVAHRNPELPIVREEKREILEKAPGKLGEIDRKLYRAYPTVRELRLSGWHYQEEPNTIGDWGFFNQWLEQHPWEKYDYILNCHDDTHVRRVDSLDELMLRAADHYPLMFANARYSEAPVGYVRGSFELWQKSMLLMLGGKIDLGPIALRRVGLTDSPVELSGLAQWNDTGIPLRNFIVDNRMESRICYLSPHYRISRYFIEGERGFMHKMEGAPWSVNAGLAAYPIQESELL